MESTKEFSTGPQTTRPGKYDGDARGRLEFLAEASNVLASALDYEHTLSAVANLAVPYLADWCVIDVLTDSGSVRRCGLAHVDPEKVRWGWELARRFPVDLNASDGVARVLRTASSLLIPRVTDDLIRAGSQDPEHLEILRALGMSSVMVVPLVARSRCLGAISFVSTESRREYGDSDLAFAEDLARRAALAVDNARLLREAQRSNRETEIILESITDAFIGLDSQWRFTYVNREAERLLGKKREQLLRRNIWHEFPEAVGSLFYEQYHKAARLRTRVDFESYYPPIDTWFEVHAFPSRDGLAVYFRDIGERKRADAALRVSSERMNLVEKAAGLVVWDWNIVTGHVEWTSNSSELYGESGKFSPTVEEWFQRVHPQDRERIRIATRNALERRREYDTEFRILLPGGGTRWLAARAHVFYDEESSRPIRMVGIHLDISARKQAEDALRISEESYRNLFETMAHGVVYQDSDGCITAANPAALRILGLRADELLGLSSIDIRWNAVDEQGREVLPHEHPSAVAVQTGRPVRGVVMRIFNNLERQYRWVKVDAIPQFRPGEPHPLRIYTVFDDITDRKLAEDTIRQSEKLAATGRLAATIAHEINNPLESVTNLLYLLDSAADLDERSRYWVTLAQQELGRVTHIARQTLAFYRDSSAPVEVDVVPLLDSVLELYARKALQKRVTLERNFENSVAIRALPGELRQVFSNLVINALESVPTGGTLRVHVFPARTWEGRPGVHIVVSDNGPGIAPQHRTRLFEPFFTTKGERGTGLGLWVSRGIVQKHGGTIRFRTSTRPQHSGTTFAVFLPAAEQSSAQVPAAA